LDQNKINFTQIKFNENWLMVTFFWGGPILRLFEIISGGGVKSEIEDVAGFK
jgi:hypothetical protein